MKKLMFIVNPNAGKGGYRASLGEVLSAGELDVVQGGYEVKFKAVELYEQLRGWMENW